MRARLLSTQGYALEAIIEVGGQVLHVMDQFSPDDDDLPHVGGEVEVDLSGFLDEGESWEEIFSGNPGRRYGLERAGGWSYRAFGRVIGINPVRVDCGVYVQHDILYTSDERVVGAFVSFRVTRLDARDASSRPARPVS